MIGDIVQPTHLLFILIVALVVLGPKRLPEVGRSLGRGLRDFKHALSTEEHDHLPSPEPYPASPPEHEAQVSEPPAEATVAQAAPGGSSPAAGGPAQQSG